MWRGPIYGRALLEFGMQTRNVFAGPYLERVSHLRDDPAWFDNALADARSRVVPMWNSRSLITEGPAAALLELREIPADHRNRENLILLGRFGGAPMFAYEIDGIESGAVPEGARFEELRTVAALMPADQAGLLGYARAMIHWRRTHRHCGRCGAPTSPGRAGHVLVCTNPVCHHEQFPRIDPAIIVLVTDGPRVLLGRQAAWPQGRYSTIAGFVEPGESLEDAVVREVAEETGVQVDQVEYHSSQPWPFPSSLMLGFTAHAATCEVRLEDQELEDARWFTRADIASGTPKLPPPVSISFRLIEDWFEAASEGPLRDVLTPQPWPEER
jgi:NAD+ diphosphatase